MSQNKKQKYTFKVSNTNSNIDIQELELWIKETVKDIWYKRELKNANVYTFMSADDALKFKFRWTFA